MKERLSRLFMALDDAVSPVAVRELRQAVQGKAVASLLVFALVVEVILVGGSLVRADVLNPVRASLEPVGRQVFQVLMLVLFGVTLFMVPAYAGVRMLVERSDGNLDLLFVTTLKPREIVAGKLFAGLYIAFVLFSACLPFMAFTYFLRGIDLLSMAIVSVFGFLSVVTGVQLALLSASVPGTRIFKGLVGAAAFSVQVTLAVSTLVGAAALVRDGVGRRVLRADFWAAAGTIVGAHVLLTSVAFVLATVALMPPVSNRARPVRVVLTLAWAASYVGAVAWARGARSDDPITGWLVTSIAVLSVTFLGTASERETLGLRVRRDIPRSRTLRPLAFLLFGGAGGGAVWCVGLAAATFALVSPARAVARYAVTTSQTRLMEVMAGVFLYAVFYGIAGRALRDRVFWRIASPGYSWAIGAGLAVALSVLPVLFAIFVLRAHKADKDLFPWLAMNPFSMLDATHRGTYLVVAATLAVCAVLPALGSLRRQVAAFQPPGSPRPPEGPA